MTCETNALMQMCLFSFGCNDDASKKYTAKYAAKYCPLRLVNSMPKLSTVFLCRVARPAARRRTTALPTPFWATVPLPSSCNIYALSRGARSVLQYANGHGAAIDDLNSRRPRHSVAASLLIWDRFAITGCFVLAGTGAVSHANSLREDSQFTRLHMCP